MGRKAVDIAIKKALSFYVTVVCLNMKYLENLKISRHCVQQTIRKFNALYIGATKPRAGRHSKLTDRQKRAIKLQQFRNDVKRFERSQQQRVHRGGGLGIWSYLTCHVSKKTQKYFQEKKTPFYSMASK